MPSCWLCMVCGGIYIEHSTVQMFYIEHKSVRMCPECIEFASSDDFQIHNDEVPHIYVRTPIYSTTTSSNIVDEVVPTTTTHHNDNDVVDDNVVVPTSDITSSYTDDNHDVNVVVPTSNITQSNNNDNDYLNVVVPSINTTTLNSNVNDVGSEKNNNDEYSSDGSDYSNTSTKLNNLKITYTDNNNKIITNVIKDVVLYDKNKKLSNIIFNDYCKMYLILTFP